MQVFEFILEIQDGTSNYEHKEWVLAPDAAMADRFAREFALHWRPKARHDPQLDVYTMPEGWPQWVLARCSPITLIAVPIVGKRRTAQIAPMPWDATFPPALRAALEILRAVADPLLADCSMEWVLSDQLDLSRRKLADVVRGIALLEQTVADLQTEPTVEQMERAA